VNYLTYVRVIQHPFAIDQNEAGLVDDDKRWDMLNAELGCVNPEYLRVGDTQLPSETELIVGRSH
jgi:hypothetical protein